MARKINPGDLIKSEKDGRVYIAYDPGYGNRIAFDLFEGGTLFTYGIDDKIWGYDYELLLKRGTRFEDVCVRNKKGVLIYRYGSDIIIFRRKEGGTREPLRIAIEEGMREPEELSSLAKDINNALTILTFFQQNESQDRA